MISDKHIGFAFMAKCAGRAMAGNKMHIIAQRPELFGDAGN